MTTVNLMLKLFSHDHNLTGIKSSLWEMESPQMLYKMKHDLTWKEIRSD